MIKKTLQNIYTSTKSSKRCLLPVLLSTSLIMSSCAQVLAPDSRNVNIPAPKFAKERKRALNERPDSVMYIPLGQDVLVPQAAFSSTFPKKTVGPFELRGETLGGALQLILDETDIPIAFETSEGLERPITVTNLKGELETVVSRVCSLADLYCSYENDILIIKDTQLFTVSLPPIGEDNELLDGVSGALEEIIGSTPIVDESTRTIIYRASNRTSEVAESYFQRLRANTALIVFETYIWEVSLDSGNSTGISWDSIENFGKFTSDINISGVTNPALGTPISIGLPTDGVLDGDKVFQFISQYGAVKTISQPQVTVLSGSTARFRVADTQNFVSEITRSVDEGEVTVSTSTDSVDTGFTLDIESNWDNATVYGNIDILLQEVRSIDTFDDNPDAIVQLPQTTERELTTQVRIRPGDSLLIAGLVREIDNFSKDGPGIQEPIFPSSRTAQTSNVELVFLLRPRVVVYTAPSKEDLAEIERQVREQKQMAATKFVEQIAVAQKPETIRKAPNVTPPQLAPVFEPIQKKPLPPVNVIDVTEPKTKEFVEPAIESTPLQQTQKLPEPKQETEETGYEDVDYVPIQPVF